MIAPQLIEYIASYVLVRTRCYDALSTVVRFQGAQFNQSLVECQAIEISGFDHLQSIYANPCFCDRCAGRKLSPNRPKIDQTEPSILP